jgi:hypothetical protein
MPTLQDDVIRLFGRIQRDRRNFVTADLVRRVRKEVDPNGVGFARRT